MDAGNQSQVFGSSSFSGDNEAAAPNRDLKERISSRTLLSGRALRPLFEAVFKDSSARLS
jgi:hypothetical protein